MTREQAEMWARVARRIGLSCAMVTRSHPVSAPDVYACLLTGKAERYFNPPANPADERMLWDWLDEQGIGASWYWAEGQCYMLLDGVPIPKEAVESCRITALGRAIDALPQEAGE